MDGRNLGTPGRHVRLRELLLGFEGLALLRGLVDGPDDEIAARIEEIRSIAGSLDEEPYVSGMDVRELDPRTGYAASAPSYDANPNPLIDVEQPVVEELVTDLAPGRALDAACGTGRHAKHLAERHDVVGVDASPEMLSVAAETVPTARFETGDLVDLPLPDGSFDVVLCALALCHLPDITPAVAELARVSRPGAMLVLSDPHPTGVAILSHLFVPTEDGGLGFVRNHHRGIGDYLAAFEAASLRVVRCIEPAMGESAVGGLGGRFVPGAMRQALVGLPGAIVWQLERG